MTQKDKVRNSIILAIVVSISIASFGCDSSLEKSKKASAKADKAMAKLNWGEYKIYEYLILQSEINIIKEKRGPSALAPYSLTNKLAKLNRIKFKYDPPDINDQKIKVYSINGPSCPSVHALEKFYELINKRASNIAFGLIKDKTIKTIPAGIPLTLVDVIKRQFIDNVLIIRRYVRVKYNDEILYMPLWAVAKSKP